MFRLLPHYHRSHQETVVPSQSQDSLSPLESSSYRGDLEEHKVLQTQPFGDGVVAGCINLEEEASLGVLNHYSGSSIPFAPTRWQQTGSCFLGLASGLDRAGANAGKDVWEEEIIGNWAHTGYILIRGKDQAGMRVPQLGGLLWRELEGRGWPWLSASQLSWSLDLGGYSLPEHGSFPFCYLPCRVQCTVGFSVSLHVVRREMGKQLCFVVEGKLCTGQRRSRCLWTGRCGLLGPW